MSRFDPKLDALRGEKSVVINWPRDENVNIDEIRGQLIAEIDRRQQRVPLDLRAVDGAPPELVDLLIECHAYARSRGKMLAVSYALPPMLSALHGRSNHKSKEAEKEQVQGDAGDLAKTVLEKEIRRSERSSYDISKAEKIDRRQKKQAKKQKLQRYYALATVVISITGIIIAAEWYVISERAEGWDTAKTSFEQPVEPEQAMPDSYHRWNDASGRFDVVAEFLRLEDGIVYLRDKQGRTISIELERLSPADRARALKSELPSQASPFMIE